MILSPLEQFEIISILPIQILCFDFSITNSLLISLLTLAFFSNMVYFFSSNENYLKKVPFFFIPNNWQMLIEALYEVVSKLVFDNVSLEGEKYFPYIAVLFTFILFSNVIGLVPYSFTVTSHLIVTFALSFSTFIGINIIGFQRHKLDMLSLIIPANTSFGLALILVPIEFISYIAKPISLGVRLFVNLMAGHTLLKVIAGFVMKEWCANFPTHTSLTFKEVTELAFRTRGSLIAQNKLKVCFRPKLGVQIPLLSYV